MKDIKIKGACIHNLKNIDICIPKNQLIVATGVSGSGKSSLMFDLVFEEGRKQYLQSLGMLSEIEDVYKFDSIEGIGPTIAVHQNTIRQTQPHSTVGTRSSILRMLTLLYSSEGSNQEEHMNPSFFSYNSANGMCMRCLGKGSYLEIDMEKLITEEHMTLREVFMKAKATSGYMNVLKRHFQDDFEKPFLSLPEDIKNEAIYGRYENGKRTYSLMKAFNNRYHKGEALYDIYARHTCCECHGTRVSQETREVKINHKHIGELCLMTILELYEFLNQTLNKVSYSQFGINLVHDILKKLEHLIDIKLGYLTLYREISSLSGGELQRLFLNTHLQGHMDSLIYILDEPTAGLHSSEKDDIVKYLQQLKKIGNTVIVVEHDSHIIKKAEHIIDVGPRAGVHGGKIIYQGDIHGLLLCEKSITGAYLSGQIKMPRRQYKTINKHDSLVIYNANTNNLKNITVSLPLHSFVGIAGKSGSGKSSLIFDTLVPVLKNYFQYTSYEDVKDNELRVEGIQHILGYAKISQEPIGRNQHSHPASYIGIWDKIREIYSQLPESIEKRLKAGYFSYHSKGACSKCKGSGYEKIWLGEHVNIHKVCPKCQGKRYRQDILDIQYNGKTISDVLDMSVDDAIEFFSEYPRIQHPLKILQQIGMGYIKLGQPTPTLSGGESQRIKLAKEIGKKRTGNILYILDEPTTGLSQYDIAKLIELLDQLVQQGHSVIVIEHDLDVLRACDYIVELGVEGGHLGGYIIAKGTCKELQNNPHSLTGRYLDV